MQASAKLRYLRMAPRKVRVVLDAIRDEPVGLALARLQHSDRRASQVVHKLLASAVANADQKFGGVEPSELFVKSAWADQGPTLKRWQPRAMGRATRIQKKTSHVTVVVASYDDEE